MDCAKGTTMPEQETITIRVARDAAQRFHAAPVEQQREMETLLGLRLHELTRQTPTLEEMMRRISQRAQERGLTPEALDEIVRHE